MARDAYELHLEDRCVSPCIHCQAEAVDFFHGMDLIDDESDEAYDFEDVDCQDCGLKFFIRPSDYVNGLDSKGNPPPVKCGRCRKGLPPLYEY